MTAAPFKRAERIADEAYRVIAEAFCYELSDPRIKNVQLTGAKMTDDLQLLRVYYFIDGSVSVRRKAEQGLNRVTGFLKRELSQKLDLRMVPEIKFFFDEGIKEGERIDKLLNELRKSGGMG